MKIDLAHGHANVRVQIACDMVAYWQYCERHVATQLADPGDHFTGDLLRIHLADPSTLSTAEITSVIYGLSFAGQVVRVPALG